MKILHIIAQLPSRTGSGVYFSNMIDGFKKYSYQQKAIFGIQEDYDWDILDKEDSYPVNFKTRELPFPIVGMSNVMPYEATLYSDLDESMIKQWQDAFISQLEKVKDEFEPDIIFSHHLWMLTSLVRQVFKGSKIIGICHNTDLRQAKMNPQLKKAYVKNIDKLDLVFTASEEQKDEIIEEFESDRGRLVAVGGGFNQDIFYRQEKKEYDEKVRLVFSGKIDPSKGIYELIEVYKDLNENDISLDIIGSPNEENKRKIEEYIGHDKTIRLYNVKDQVALGHELRKKDIYLMPSYYEGLGLMAIESLACGLYVVTTEIEALMTLLGKEIKESGVIKYVELPGIYDIDKPLEEDLPDYKKRLKSAMEEQIQKVRKRQEFPDEIRERIKEFSWEGLVARMNKIVKDIRN